jgi:hypothetical protein
MNKFAKMLIGVAALALPSAACAGHSELTVPPSDTFELGGDQSSPMSVAGKNVGQTAVVILARTKSGEISIASVAPGGTFAYDFAVGETALIRNTSGATPARLSVDFSGSPSSLSMTYSLPSKK